MKIMVIGPEYFNYTDSVAWALAEQGHRVSQQLCGDFWQDASYWERKFHKWGIVQGEDAYYREWNRQVVAHYREFSPDVCLVLNGDHLFADTLELLRSSRLILWLLDSIRRMPHNEVNLPYYHGIFSFEHGDGEYLRNRYGLDCGYCPVGYDPRIYFPAAGQRDLDIVFVGVPVARRLAVLRPVAAYAESTGRSLAVYGPFWDPRYFWKKNRFARRNRSLARYAHNGALPPAAVAAVYRRAKVCLNIHIPEHEGINPRTFEILATGSFQLVDQKPLLGQLLATDRDLVAYGDEEELLAKLDHYLHHDAAREVIAQRGLAAVAGKYSIKERVQQVLSGEGFP